MCDKKMYRIFLIHFAVIISYVSAFNLSPQPNFQFTEPQLPIFLSQERASYFGYSVTLRQNGLFIGSPRSQSTLASQRKVNETGAVYKCQFDTQTCRPYNFDILGNVDAENTQFTYDSEMKDYQMLGGAMDGHGSDSSKLVVCAPKLKAYITDHYMLHGVCYWTQDTVDEKPDRIFKIAPLRQRNFQVFPDADKKQYFYYIYGEQGLSVHVPENSNEIIMGAPGVANWKGTIIRHRTQAREDHGGLNRRSEPGHQNHTIAKRQVIEYVSDVPNPLYFQLPDDSYFGYAVSSGYFYGPGNEKLLYVASAPQANLQTGEVHIFDIIDLSSFPNSEKAIKSYFKFEGQQIGEYFGYTMLTEDFNGDGFPDLAVSAPFHSKDREEENGVVYIYKNEGALNFNLHATLSTDYDGSGRFGIALSKIGDINLDGYNDIAIGAPFEGNGAVYIYLGGPTGLSSTPSQKIIAPESSPAKYGDSYMFGHAISRGVDIDGNFYNDLAIGSPNKDSVFVYKAYPVVKVMASITPSKSELSISDTSFTMKACWRYETSKIHLDRELAFNVQLKVDSNVAGRANFDNNERVKELQVTISNTEKCQDFKVNVQYNQNDIFKPIDLELIHDIVQKVPQTGEFCDSCVTTNPSDGKITKNKVVFSTGCAGSTCLADLKLRSELVGVNLPYTLGSTKTMTIDYLIENTGETSYLPQMTIEIPKTIAFAKIPSNCKLDENVLHCDIGSGSPLFKNNKERLRIILDTSYLDGQRFEVNATAFSASEEVNKEDNTMIDSIPLREFSEVEIIGKSSKLQLSLEDGLRVENITHQFEIRNNGPSHIKEMEVTIMIPLSYVVGSSSIDIVDFDAIDLQASYINKVYDISWTKNNLILIKKVYESSSATPQIIDNLHATNFDGTNIGMVNELHSSAVDNHQHMDHSEQQHSFRRRRRDLADAFNESPLIEDFQARQHHVQARSVQTFHDENILANLPFNRTIFFKCHTIPLDDENLCVKGTFSVRNFRAGSAPIMVNINYTVDGSIIDQLFNTKQDIFVIQTSATIRKLDDENGETIKTTYSPAFTVFYKHLLTETPIWIYIVSIISGLLILVLISATFYKLGFFKRTQKEEMERLTRASTHAPASDTDDE